MYNNKELNFYRRFVTMVKGEYPREYAIRCCYLDKCLFRKMKRRIFESRSYDIWVRRVELGDIIVSQTKIIRWKIIESKGKLYLGFIESKAINTEDKHNKFSMYVVKQDVRGTTSQRYILARVKTSNVHELLW